MPSPTGEFKLKSFLGLGPETAGSQVKGGPLYLVGVRVMTVHQTGEDFSKCQHTMGFKMEDGSLHEVKITHELVEEMHDNPSTQVAFQKMVAKTLAEKIEKEVEDLFVHGAKDWEEEGDPLSMNGGILSPEHSEAFINQIINGGPTFPSCPDENLVTLSKGQVIYPFKHGTHTEAPMNTTTEKDTIEFMRQRPHARARDLSKVPCGTIAHAMQARIGSTIAAKLVAPEPRAVQFYLLNHAASLLEERYGPKEPLPAPAKELFEAYHGFLNRAVIEAAYYLILICTREIRHGKNIIGSQNPKIFESYSPEIKKFFDAIPHDSQEAQMKFRKSPPDVHLGQWTDFMERGFFVSGWGGSYGGKKWGEIAKQLNLWVHGHLSGIGLLDVIWALCHNGGPIFNKGMIYGTYNNSKLKKILDVQRAGFMPQYVLEKTTGNTETNEIMKLALAACGPELTGLGFVDWYSVEATGVGTYGPEKEKQTIKHGAPTSGGGQEKNDLLAELLDTAQAAKAGQWKAQPFVLAGHAYTQVVPA